MITVLAQTVSDLAVGLLLVLVAFLPGLSDGSAMKWVPVLLGAGLVVHLLRTPRLSGLHLVAARGDPSGPDRHRRLHGLLRSRN